MESNLQKSQWLWPTIWHFQCLVGHEIILSELAGIQDKENCLKLSSIKKDKELNVYEMTSARIKYLLLGWIGGKEASKGQEETCEPPYLEK